MGMICLILTVVGVWKWRSIYGTLRGDKATGGLWSIGVKVDPTDYTAAITDLEGEEDFVFAIGEGSGWHGLDIVEVLPRGQCRYTFMISKRTADKAGRVIITGSVKQARFDLSPNTVRALRELLLDINYYSLHKSYHQTAIADGTQWCVLLAAGGQAKGVYCNNYFPAELLRLSTFVHEEILKRHADDIDRAKELPASTQRWDAWLWKAIG
jgi:hypothetical protein